MSFACFPWATGRSQLRGELLNALLWHVGMDHDYANLLGVA